MLSIRFAPRPIGTADAKVFSLSSPKSWRLRARYLLVFVAAISLSMHLSSLMAKNDAKPVMWTPPVEPPGAVIVTRHSFEPQPTTGRPSIAPEVSDVKVFVAGQVAPLDSHAPAKQAATEELLAALTQWSDAWRRQDMNDYLGAYAPSFVPTSGGSREAWAKQRTARITSKQSIRHEVRDVQVQWSENKAIVKFTQVYADERLQQTDQKTMHWVLNNGRWQIARELAH
jgi:hypothetical protein